ncbi:hypothetical protein Q9L58_005440 [Maublancomyces gigas]|uniref:Growth hormone-inducible transmembrane protein n=1 Tax=Discina gigas TaxID=1032678 RepID=A0ABR3GI52_9PEZI
MLLLNTIRRPLGATILAAKPLARLLSTSPAIRPPILRQAFARHPTLKSKNPFLSKRFFTTEPAIVARPPRQEAIQKLLYSGALFGGTLLVANLLFNRETRDTAIPLYERAYLQETFTYTGVGVGMIALAAKGLHNAGWSYRLLTANPWAVLGIGLVASIGTMIGTRATDPDNYIQKHVLWSAFNLSQAALLAPLYFYSPAILARAGMYTVGVIGSIAFVAATAKEDKYLYLGGPLLAGVAVVALSGLAPMVLPLGSRALMGAEALWMYGGLAVFGGFTLYDVQKIMNHARLAEQGLIKKDTVNESISLELDFLNIFIRLVQILAQRQNNRK